MNPRVRRAPAPKDRALRLDFTNGERAIYDCSPLPNCGVFKELNGVAHAWCMACPKNVPYITPPCGAKRSA